MKYVILLHILLYGQEYDVSLHHRYISVEQCMQVAEQVVIPTISQNVSEVSYTCIIKKIEQREVWL